MKPIESENISDLATALAKAQGAMGPAIINKVNPHFRNRYADLAAVLEAVRKPLADNGLSVTQTTHLSDDVFVLRTTLRHASGQWIASEYPLPIGAKPQELGSALTYGRRYEISAMIGVAADEDDDGEATRKTNGKDTSAALITTEQVIELRALFYDIGREKAPALTKGWLRFFNIEKIEDLPYSRYAEGVSILENKRQAQVAL